MANHRQHRAQEYRRRAKEARARAAAAATATVRKTQLDDAEMFERMAQLEENASTPDAGDKEFPDWEPDRWADHYRFGSRSYKDKADNQT